MRALPLAVLAFLAACGGADDTDVGTCSTITDGTYSVTGTCFTMSMTTDLSFDQGTCTATFDNWDMVDDVPTSATLSDLDVTLVGANWGDCTGTLAGGELSGSCPDGCTWVFTPTN